MFLMPVPGCTDNLLYIRIAGIPAQNLSGLFARSNELCGVACAAGTHFHLDVFARSFLCRFNHFLNGEALTIAEVEDIAVAALAQVFERQHMIT